MTELQDPIEIYRASLAELPAREEAGPPTLQRCEVWPYPDLQRLWVRVETTPFATFPDLSFVVSDPEGTIVCSMFIVGVQERYQAVTLHLRQASRPGETYRLDIELSRDGVALDVRTLTFELTFRDPDQRQEP